MDSVTGGPILQFLRRLAEIFQELAVEKLDLACGTQGTHKPRNGVDDQTKAFLTLLERRLVTLAFNRNRRKMRHLLDDLLIAFSWAARRAPTRPCAIHTCPISCPRPRPTRSPVSCCGLPPCRVLPRDPRVRLKTGRYSWTEGSAQLPAEFSSRWDRSAGRCSNIRWRPVLQLGIELRE